MNSVNCLEQSGDCNQDLPETTMQRVLSGTDIELHGNSMMQDKDEYSCFYSNCINSQKSPHSLKQHCCMVKATVISPKATDTNLVAMMYARIIPSFSNVFQYPLHSRKKPEKLENKVP